MKTIVLSSGNVVPALSEQEEYRRRWREQFENSNSKLYRLIPKRKLRSWDISTSGISSFRQNGYSKKTGRPSDSWRKYKGFQRDKAKNKPWCKCNITDSRAGHRAWQRDCIRKGLTRDNKYFEELHSYNKNMFTSGWDCC